MKKNKIIQVSSVVFLSLLLAIMGCTTPSPASPSQPTATTTPATPTPMTLRFASTTSSTQIISQAEKFWGDEVEKRTNGRIKFEYFWGGTLAKPGEDLDTLQKGVYEIGLVGQSYNVPKLPLLNVTFAVPWGPSDVAVLEKLIAKLYEQPELSAEVAKYNAKIIFPAIVEAYQIVSKQPMRNLSEMKGKKIAGLSANLPILAASGLVPVAIPAGERFTALQTGVVEASFLGTTFSDTLKLQEVAKNLNLIGYGAVSVSNTLMNMDTWKKIAPADQQILMDVAKTATQWQTEKTNAAVAEIIARWKTQGVAVYDFSAEDRKIWASATKDLPRQWAKDRDAEGLAGTKILEAYFKAAQDVGYTFPFDTSIK